MIKKGAKLTIRRIPLSHLRVTETVSCFPEKFDIYLKLLQEHPELDLDPMIVYPAEEYPGIFDIDNGKHRFCSSIMAGRCDALCIVVEDE